MKILLGNKTRYDDNREKRQMFQNAQNIGIVDMVFQE
jgi:hypothetical protein